MSLNHAAEGAVRSLHTVRLYLPLDRLRPGEVGCVTAISPDSPLRERLGDFGILPPCDLRCERVSLFGDPVAYRILPSDGSPGTVIALRRRDAAALTVCVRRRVRLQARRDMPWD